MDESIHGPAKVTNREAQITLATTLKAAVDLRIGELDAAAKLIPSWFSPRQFTLVSSKASH